MRQQPQDLADGGRPSDQPSSTVVVQHIFPREIQAKTERYEELWPALDEYVRTRLPARAVEVQFLSGGRIDVYTPASKTINDQAVASACVNVAARTDVGVVAVACFVDPGVPSAAREAAVPVVGAGFPAVSRARSYGFPVGIVVVADAVRIQVSELIESGYFGGRPEDYRSTALAGWSYDRLAAGLLDRDTRLVESFRQSATELIADGARVVIAGCAYLGALLTQHGVHSVGGVPVVDSFGASLELAGSLAVTPSGSDRPTSLDG